MRIQYFRVGMEPRGRIGLPDFLFCAVTCTAPMSNKWNRKILVNKCFMIFTVRFLLYYKYDKDRIHLNKKVTYLSKEGNYIIHNREDDLNLDFNERYSDVLCI